MGVKISEIIPKKEIEFKDLANKVIAVDFSNSAYQFLSSIRQPDGTLLMDNQGRVTSHLMGIVNRFSNLLERGIRLIIVFDGKSPLLKIKEQEAREQRKRLAEKKLKQAQEAGDVEMMQRYSKQTSRLIRPMVEESKVLLKAMGVPCVQAPGEADAQIAFICEKGDAYAAATSDFDPLLFGCPRTITNLTISQRKRLPSGSYINVKPEMIELKGILNNLGINQDQLLALAILIGTDYNVGGVKGVGPKTALKLVKEFKDFDRLFKEAGADFNWKKIYAVFKSMPIMKNYQIKYSDVDAAKMIDLLVEKHDFSKERVEKVIERLTKREKDQSGLDKWVR